MIIVNFLNRNASIVFGLIFLAFAAAGGPWALSESRTLAGAVKPKKLTKKVLMMVPDEFVWREYFEPRKVYEEKGYKVVTASRSKEAVFPDQKSRIGWPQAAGFVSDLNFELVDVTQYDAITFVGGNGAWKDFFPNQKVHDIVRAAWQTNQVVGLLCSATGLLGFVNSGEKQDRPIAEGKKAVGYYRVESILRKLAGVDFIGSSALVAVDGQLVTGRNPEASKSFAESIILAIEKNDKYIH